MISSYKNGDGLLPGKYTAKVICFVGTPSEANPSSFIDMDRVPQDFHPEIAVEKGGGPMDIKIDVPAKKK